MKWLSWACVHIARAWYRVLNIASYLLAHPSRNATSRSNRVTLFMAMAIAYSAYAPGAENGEVRGLVATAQGVAQPYAEVELHNAAGLKRSTHSNAAGEFAFTDIEPGPYQLRANVNAAGTGILAVSVAAGQLVSVTLTLGPEAAPDLVLNDIVVVAEHLDKARNALSAKTGTSQYIFDKAEIAALPRGENTPINQMMLQAPGVVQGDYGELHVRGEMMPPQYRINGIVIPEGISGFGQTFEPRFADRIEFITGALPAQYNYRTSGVIDIHTKQHFENGGSVGLYGGSYSTVSPSFELGGAKDSLTYYLSGSYLQSDNGILLPTPDRDAIHDHTQQGKDFGYFSFLPNDSSRVSLIFGAAEAKFEIPNVPGQTPTFPLNGVNAFPPVASADLNENQREHNRYAVLSYEGGRGDDLDYQAAFFTRYSSVEFVPDTIGDLIYRGIASRVERSNVANGVQFDASLEKSEQHTIRFGLSASHERTDSNDTSAVFPADANGVQVPGAPFTVDDSRVATANLIGVYVQDEWRSTKELTINYGVRFDYLDGLTQDSQFSPRLGAVYKWSARTTLHAGYARYFNPPRLELVGPDTISKFANTTNQPEVQESSPVVSERINYFDIGLTHHLTPDWNVAVNGYYKDAKNLNDFGQFGQALIYSPFNWAQTRIYGIELSIYYNKDNLSGYFNTAVSRARAKGISSGQFNFEKEELDYINGNWVYMDHDQLLAASAGVSYRWSKVRLLADALYGSGMRSTPGGGTPNSDHLPSYVQVNAGVARDFDGTTFGKLEGRFSIVNVFDRVYEIRDGTGVGVGAPQFGPRRSIFVTIKKDF